MAVEITDRYVNPAKMQFVRAKDVGQHLLDITLWLQDSTRTGLFARHYVIEPVLYKKVLAGFYFSDHNTAFEFKMRWG